MKFTFLVVEEKIEFITHKLSNDVRSHRQKGEGRDFIPDAYMQWLALDEAGRCYVREQGVSNVGKLNESHLLASGFSMKYKT